LRDAVSAWPPQKWGGFFVGVVLKFVDFVDVVDIVDVAVCFLAVFCDFLIFFLTKL